VRTYPYRLDPGILDCALQTIFACVDDLPDDSLIMLVELERYVFHGYGGEQLICWTRLRPRTSADLLSADIVLLTENGGIVAELQGAHVRRASREQLTRAIKTPPKVAKADVVGRRSSPAETRLPSGPFDPAQLRASLIRGVAQVLGNSADEIEFDEPLQNLGLDSMMALELRDMLTREIGRTLPAATFLGRTSVSVLEKAFAEQLGSGSGVTVDPSTIMVERVGPGGMQVTELGSGQPVVFVHGGAFGGVEAWQAQLPLAARWHLIVPSRLNYGQSPTSIREDFEEDGKLIAELLGEGAHVVAQSYGTVGAMLAAAARPDAVLSLTLIESAASSVARGNAVVGDYERGMQRLLAQPPTEPGELLAAVFRFIDPDLSFPHPLPEELKRFADRIPQLRWPWEADIPVAALRAASFPTLVVTGGGRPVFEVIGDALADQLGAQRVTVPGGHGTQNVGGLFNAVLERFLNEASVPASARIGVRA
jgi:pimeloyl-ACP methyl ester carboxylesterase/acyl carrier protein